MKYFCEMHTNGSALRNIIFFLIERVSMTSKLSYVEYKNTNH